MKKFFTHPLTITVIVILVLVAIGLIGKKYWGWFSSSQPEPSPFNMGMRNKQSGITYMSPKLSTDEIKIVKNFESQLRAIQSQSRLSDDAKIAQARAVMANVNSQLKAIGLEANVTEQNATAKQNCGCALCWELCIILCFHCCRNKCCSE